MSLSAKYWGEHVWETMYIIAYTFPAEATAEDKRHVTAIYKNLAFVLPCDECRDHYQSFMSQHPIENTADSRGDILKWVNDLQNSINTKLRKPPVNLHHKVLEMDRYNDQKTPVPVKTDPAINKRVGAVSYGIRRPPGRPPRFNKKGCFNCHKPLS